jgi:hypothetical protein
MKIDFKIDYISRTAAHYTSFTLSAQSSSIRQKNLRDQVDRAQQVQSEIGRRAWDKALQQMKGSRVNTFG